jgi:hypothetical protein
MQCPINIFNCVASNFGWGRISGGTLAYLIIPLGLTEIMPRGMVYRKPDELSMKSARSV